MTTAATLGRRPPCLHARKSDGPFRRLMRRVTDELVRWDKPRRAKCALLDMHESQFSRAENDLVGQVFSMDKYHDAAVAERVPDPVRQRVGPVEPVGHSYRDPDRDGIAGTGRDRQRMEDRLGAAWAAYRHAPSLATAFQVALAAVALWWMWTYPAAAPAAAGELARHGA